MVARGGSRTDRARLHAMTDEELGASIADDPDEPAIAEDAWTEARVVRGSDEQLVWLDHSLVEFLHGQGGNWLSRINDVLRAHQQAVLKS